MAAPNRRVVTAIEPALLGLVAAAFALVVVLGIITGWVWIPGSSRGDGHGIWINRAESLGDYLIYLTIMVLATLGALALALERWRRFKQQGSTRR